MKIALLFFLLLSGRFVTAAEEPSIPALKAIEQFGSITISDGSSFFTFSNDGSFHSGPLSESGREFAGHWKADGLKFTVIATLGWLNGLSKFDDYRRIVFVIYDVRKKPSDPKPWRAPLPNLVDTYFLIDELVEIPKPAGAN